VPLPGNARDDLGCASIPQQMPDRLAGAIDTAQKYFHLFAFLFCQLVTIFLNLG